MFSSPTTINGVPIKATVKGYYHSLVMRERPYLKGLLSSLMGNAGEESVAVDMQRLITVATAHLYWLILEEAPAPVIAPFNGYVSRMVTTMAQPPLNTDLIYFIYLILKNHEEDSESERSSLPDGIKHMYS